MGNDENYTLNDYQKGFNQLTNFIKNIPNNKDIINQGYFVDYQKYNDFKKIYDSLVSKQQQSAINNTQGQQEIDLKELESSKLYTENADNLYKNLLNNKPYILINESLCQLICIKNKEKGDNNLIHFFHNNNDLILCNSDGKKQYFRLKFKGSNIFNRESLYVTPSQISSTDNGTNAPQVPPNTIDVQYNVMSQDIINFFLNENKISQFLTYPNSQKYKGFLVDESWVQKWKNNYNYNDIETKYLKGKFVESQTQLTIPIIAKELKQKMINNNGLDNISPYILQNINQIPQGKSYMILDEKFLKSYINIQNSNLKSTNFIISQNNINIENTLLNFQTNKNCLNNINLIPPSSTSSINKAVQPQPQPQQNAPMNQLNNNINNENAQFLKHLLKYEYFKKEYYMPAQNLKNAYIVDYHIIKTLMEIYNSKAIFEAHFKPKTEINYQNFETYYNIISKNISNDILKQPSAQEINNLKNDMNNVLFIKTFNNQPNILYADNFVLIDPEFATFLSQKFSTTIKMCPINYKVVDGKIFMVLQLKQLVIYQISSFTNNENFATEFILFPNYQSQTINNELLTLITGYGYLYWLKMNSPINLNYGIQFSFIPINNNQLNNQQNNLIQNGSLNNNNIKVNTERPGQSASAPNISTRVIPMNINTNSQLRKSMNNSLINRQLSNANNNPSNSMNNQQILDENLRIAISLIQENHKLENIIKQPNGNRNDQKKEYYLINEKYLKEISNKLNTEKISREIALNIDKDESQLLNIAKASLDVKTKNALNGLKKEDIQNSLNSEKYELKHHYVNNDKSTNLLYYKHCDIISEKLLYSLKSIDQDINKKSQKVECVFDHGIIIIFLNNYIINVAHFDNEIFVKQIIIAGGQNNSYNLQQIFNQFDQKGYTEFMKSFSNSNNLIYFNININNQPYLVQAHIYNITEEGKLVYMPSDRLKTMILLAVSQIYNYPANQKERVYLMNYKWLEEYKYSDIKKKSN